MAVSRQNPWPSRPTTRRPGRSHRQHEAEVSTPASLVTAPADPYCQRQHPV